MQNYLAELESLEWREKRHEIILRDRWKCQECFKEAEATPLNMTNFDMPFFIQKEPPILLQVHHKYYIKGNRAWEYDDTALITWCSECHTKFHKMYCVPVKVPHGVDEDIKLTQCEKCNGTGYLPEFSHYMHGICFQCNGSGYF
jgi:hypothetical protein